MSIIENAVSCRRRRFRDVGRRVVGDVDVDVERQLVDYARFSDLI